jgi:hypothetical protein
MKNSRFLPVLAASVAAGSSIRDAAQAAGCSESNAYTISRSHEFRELVTTIRNEAIASAVGVLGSAAAKAAQTLVDLLSDEHEAKDRLAAARLILANLGPIQELGELRERITKIEGQASLRVVR